MRADAAEPAVRGQLVRLCNDEHVSAPSRRRADRERAAKHGACFKTRGIIAADLVRSRRAYGWIVLFTLLANPMVKHDARVSVAQAFTRPEVLQLRDQAGLDFASYHSHFGHRFVLAGEKAERIRCCPCHEVALMNREKIAWTLSLILIAIIAFQLPGSVAHRDDDYAFVKTLIDIHRQVDNNYVDPLDEEKLKLGSVNGMMGELDPYSIFIPAAKTEEFDNLLEGSFKGVGIELSQLENGDIQVVTPIPDSPAHKAGVQAGDIILKVNGVDIKGKKISDVQSIIKGPLGSEVRLTVKHLDGQEVELKMTRQEIVMPTVMGYRRDAKNNWDYWVSQNPKIAYVRITQFTATTTREMKKVARIRCWVRGCRGLVLDLRFNPGGRLDQAKDVVNLFINEGIIVVTKGMHRAQEVARADAAKALTQKFPIIVLVNEHSASAAEIVAGSLMDNKRALVLGTRTYGKGSVQEIIPLEPDEGELKLTVAYYYLPSGRLVHRKKGATDWGVDPQVNVPMSEKAEQQVLREQGEAELFHKPLPVTTRPTTSTSTHPATQPVVDVQLQQAVSAMMSSIILNGEHQLVADHQTARALPSTQPVSQ